MLRYGLVGVLVVGLIGTAVVWGGGPPAGMGREGPAGGMPSQAAMMTGMMMRGDIAAWGGTVFALRGRVLMKLDADLSVVESVEIPAPRPGPGMGAGMTGMPGGGMMGRMQGRMMGGMASLAADSQGVYVLSGSTITVYSHDLTEVRSGRLAAPAEAEEEGAEGKEGAQQGEHPGSGQPEHPAR